jgi:predicted ester cyclase
MGNPRRHTLPTESNKALWKAFFREVWGRGNLDFADSVFDPNYVRHDLRPGSSLAGPEGQKKIASDFRTAFPDLTVTIDLLFGEAEMVVARWTMSGTHTGLWGNVAPTGRRATFSGVNIVRFSKGKVVELWNHRDDLGLVQQIGAFIYAGTTPD